MYPPHQSFIDESGCGSGGGGGNRGASKSGRKWIRLIRFTVRQLLRNRITRSDKGIPMNLRVCRLNVPADVLRGYGNAPPKDQVYVRDSQLRIISFNVYVFPTLAIVDSSNRQLWIQKPTDRTSKRCRASIRVTITNTNLQFLHISLYL